MIEFSRQPRFLPEFPRGEVEVPNPPAAQEKPDISWFSILAPPGVMLVVTLLIAMTTRSFFLLLSIAMTVMTLLVSLTNAASQIRKFKKRKKERETKYLQFIADVRSELAVAREQQTKAMLEMHPGPEECIRRMERLDRKLWEKTPAYDDFLALRIGVGSAPLERSIKYEKQAVILESDPLLMEPHRLALEFGHIPNVPITVNLVQSELCGIAGEPEKTVELATLLLLQLITHHGYDDVKVVILASEDRLDHWMWLRFVPHLWDDDFRFRFLVCGQAMARQVLSALHDVIREREKRAESGRILAIPHYVFIVEDPSLLENEPIAKYLYEGAAKLGVSSVFMAENAAYLPMNCNLVISLRGKSGELANRKTGEKQSFMPDSLAGLRNLDIAARRLTPLRIKSPSARFSLPTSFTLLEMAGVQRAEQFDALGQWLRNRTYTGMSVPIGVKAGGTPFCLDLHETGHGPHGLVAGTTGSGKSELLQSIIISLAMHYHPHDVVFVLIDYKGGGMADAFRGLPHLAGTITNLGGNQTTRALLSIKSELLRRQKLFSEFGVNNIDRYQKLYHGKSREGMPAVPHLVMIADEFAELKQDQPDFMKELVSAARVGRSLGIHLILATQKPAGIVDDQIWSNSKFRICLIVQDETDSKDVIKRPDAALLKEPGRAYIQVGSDELFELFQSAYAGAEYDPDGRMQEQRERTKRIYRLALNGLAEQIYPLEEEKIAGGEVPTQLSAMVEHLRRTAEQAGIKPLDGPWMPPLPDTLYLDDVIDAGGPARMFQPKRETLLAVPVGLLDDPRGQRQEPLVFDFVSEGNLIVYGAPGTGKTTLIRSLCMSLATLYSPDDVHVYLLDFGGSGLRRLEELPHVGGVLTLEQENELEQFMRYLSRLMEERKGVFEASNADGFAAYREQGGSMPAVIVIVDHYMALSETYDEMDEKMVVLAREGVKYGIFLIVTAVNGSSVRYRFAVNFRMAVSYSLTDRSDYDAIVGRTHGLEPGNTAGRGLVRGNPPLEFQTALPAFRHRSHEEWLRDIQQAAGVRRAAPIPLLPHSIDIRGLNRDTAPLAIGLAVHDLQPVFLDLAKHPVVAVVGESETGKSSLLVSWIKMLAERQPDLEVYALDSASLGLYPLMGMPNVTDLGALEDLREWVDSMKEKLDDRRRELMDWKTAGRSPVELAERWNQIVFVFDRWSGFTGGDMYALQELLERIIKQDRDLKVAVLAADQTNDLGGNWDSLGKLLREEQVGVLLGSLRDQRVFDTSLPYGTQEKHFEFGDGYWIAKNKHVRMRYAFWRD